MRLSSVRINRIISRVLVLALLSWLIGAGYRNCCAFENAGSSAKITAERYASPAVQLESSTHPQLDHCQKTEQENAGRGTPNDELKSFSPCTHHSAFIVSMPCCSLSAQAFDGARKVRVVPERLAQVAKNEQLQPFAIRARDAALSTERVIHNRGETYLRDCIFLI